MREYVLSHGPCRLPQRVYFSLGSKESKTRNPMLQSVSQDTQEIAAFYRGRGVDTLFELNPGNHFDHPEQRTARGIAWLLGGQDAACPAGGTPREVFGTLMEYQKERFFYDSGHLQG